MLEILGIIYLTGKIGTLAEQKGLKKGIWKFYMVLAWFGGEILGIVLGIITFGPDNIVGSVMVGYALAITNYFLLKSILSKKPNAVDTSFEFEDPNHSDRSY